MPNAKFRGKDFGGESTSFTAPLGVTAVTNLTFDDFAADIAAIAAALANFSYIPLHEQFVAIDEAVSDQATDENGQRESKARVKYVDTITGSSYDIEIPAPILTGRLTAGSSFFNLAQAQVAALVTALEAGMRAPGTDNVINIVSIQHVGRNI